MLMTPEDIKLFDEEKKAEARNIIKLMRDGMDDVEKSLYTLEKGIDEALFLPDGKIYPGSYINIDNPLYALNKKLKMLHHLGFEILTGTMKSYIAKDNDDEKDKLFEGKYPVEFSFSEVKIEEINAPVYVLRTPFARAQNVKRKSAYYSNGYFVASRYYETNIAKEIIKYQNTNGKIEVFDHAIVAFVHHVCKERVEKNSTFHLFDIDNIDTKCIIDGLVPHVIISDNFPNLSIIYHSKIDANSPEEEYTEVHITDAQFSTILDKSILFSKIE